MNLDEVVIRHIGWIRKKAMLYYSDLNDAEDLASETICKCLSHSQKFDNERNFKPWVLTIMENTFKTQYARRKCVKFTGYEDSARYESDNRTDNRAIATKIISIIRQCARRSQCIECVLLYAKGFNYDEIGRIVGISLGTVKSRIFAGRRMLRRVLENGNRY